MNVYIQNNNCLHNVVTAFTVIVWINELLVHHKHIEQDIMIILRSGQTRMRVDESWEARVCTRVLSTLMCRSNEDESRWELRSESLRESSLNSHAPVKRGERWPLRMLPVTQSKPVIFINCKFCTVLLSLLLQSAKQWQFCNSHQLSWLVKRAQTCINSHQNLNQFKVDDSWWEWMRVGGQTPARVSTLILVWPGF